jgi:hypothetical protein
MRHREWHQNVGILIALRERLLKEFNLHLSNNDFARALGYLPSWVENGTFDEQTETQRLIAFCKSRGVKTDAAHVVAEAAKLIYVEACSLV